MDYVSIRSIKTGELVIGQVIRTNNKTIVVQLDNGQIKIWKLKRVTGI